MANRSFFVFTFFAMLIGIGLAELVQSVPHRNAQDSRASMLGMCLTSGIGCGRPSATF